MKKKLQSLEEFKPMAISGSMARKVTGGVGDIFQGTNPNSGGVYADERRLTYQKTTSTHNWYTDDGVTPCP